METRGLDITRLIMSVIAIILAIVLGVIVGDYFYTLNKGEDIGKIFLIFIFPIFMLMAVVLIVNAIMGVIGVTKYFKNKNIALVDRNNSNGLIIVKIIVAILGVSAPLLIAYICDIIEINKKKNLNQ